MNVIRYEQRFAAAIATLLNEHLPFQPESEQTVDAAGGIRYVAIIDEKVVGYIAGYEIEQFEQEFPYFEAELQPLRDRMTNTTIYTSHFVVDPAYRKRGIGSALVAAYMEEAEALAELLVVVGWVQSDTNTWAAEKQFVQAGFQSYRYIERYFEPYNVYCPSCEGTCYCDAHIVVKHVASPILH